MKILLTLAWRNIWRNKRRSLITISSVLFAVILSIIFYSMEKGAYQRMIDNMVKYSTGYIQIQDVFFDDEPSIDNSLHFDQQMKNLMDDMSEEFYYAPRIQYFALAAGDNTTRGTMIYGIDPAAEAKIKDPSEDLVRGEFISSNDNDIVVSEGLADIMGIEIGDTLVLLGQGFQGATAAGKYRVKGIINLKVPEMNNNTVYMSLTEAQWFFVAENRLTSLVIMPYKPKQTNQIANELQEKVDDEWYKVYTWEYLLSDLLKLMKFDMAGTMVMLMILYVVIAFGIFGTILTMIVERLKEFGMLISLGMKRGQLALVCFLETIFLSISGAIIGMVAAFPIVLYFYHYPIKLTGEMATTMEDYGFEPIMPFSIDPSIFFTQAQIVLAISLLIGLYPVYKVFNLNVMKVKQP